MKSSELLEQREQEVKDLGNVYPCYYHDEEEYETTYEVHEYERYKGEQVAEQRLKWQNEKIAKNKKEGEEWQ